MNKLPLIILLSAPFVMMATLAGCTSEKEARRAVESLGMEFVRSTGYRPFSCSEDDMFRTGFEAVDAKGRPVTGTVCSALLKGATVRLD